MSFFFFIVLYIFFAALFYIWIYVALKELRKTWMIKAELFQKDKVKLLINLIIFPVVLAIGLSGLITVTIEFIELITSFISDL